MFLEYLRTSYVYLVPPVLGFFVMVGLALASLLRGRKSPTNILFAGICFIGAVINADVAAVSLIPDKNAALRIDRATYVVTVFSVPVYIQFVHAFLQMRSRRWIETLAYGASIVFVFFTQTEHFIPGFHHYSFGTIARAGPAYHAFSCCVAVTVIYCLYVLYRGVRQVRDNVQKNRAKYILGGLGLSGLLIALNILPVLGLPVYPMGNFSFVPAIFLAYGVLKYDLLDMGAMIRRGVLYFLLTGVLTVMYLLILYAFHALFMATGIQQTVVLPFVLALVMVLLFQPLRQKVKAFVDHLFFRGKYDYRQVLGEISTELASLKTADQIRHMLLVAVSRALDVQEAHLAIRPEGSESFLLHSEGEGRVWQGEKGISAAHPLMRQMGERRRPLSRVQADFLSLPAEERRQVAACLDALGATLAIPLLARDELVGILATGQKRSGELLVQEDIELLTTIANQGAVALENARSYEALQKLNLDLERKVEERTADLRRALAEKEKTQRQLVQSESLAAIGQLVAGTAHEMNNPLASASSLVETSAEAIGDWQVEIRRKEEVLDDLCFALKELRRAGDIVKSLLDLSRQSQTYVEPVQIPSVLDDALRVLHNSIKRLPVQIVRHDDPDLPAIEGNFANLGQVFINILRNALQSLPEGKGEITLSACRAGDNVLVQCKDTGQGIPPSRIKDVFKPFFTTKAVGEGTGLGLYISYEVVKKHGGEIDIRSEVGRGTIVTVTLPCRRNKT